MADYVTDQGLEIPTIESLLTEIAAEQRAKLDPLLNTTADDPIGQVNGIFASHLREAWETLAIAYNGFNPDAAEGFLLEALSALTGTKREKASKSRFKGTRKLKVNLDDGTEIPAGSVVAVDGRPDIRFVLLQTVINNSGDVADAFVEAEAEADGAVTANANTVTVIATPVSGWNTVTNDEDAEVGTDRESETALRQRRERELRATGSGTVDAIYSDVIAIEVDGVKTILSAQVLQNVEDFQDADTGLPPHSYEVIVYDGLSHVTPVNTIAQTIWNSGPAGIKPYGSTSGSAIDAQGNTQTVPFTWATLVELLIECYIVVDPVTFVGIPAARTIVSQEVAALKLGDDVAYSKILSIIQGITGVIRIDNGPGGDQALQISRFGSVYGLPFVNLEMGPREKAVVETTHIDFGILP